MCAKRIARHNIYMIGEAVPQIIDNKLPSKRQVLKVLFYNIRESKLTLSESASLTIKQVFPFWEKACLPTQRTQHCKSKLIKLYNKWRNVQKNRNRAQSQGKYEGFSTALDNLFDIANANIMEMVDEKRRQFLVKQRTTGRVGVFEDIKTINNDDKKFLIPQEDIDCSQIKKNNKQKNSPLVSSNGSSQTTGTALKPSFDSICADDCKTPIFMKSQQPKELCENTNNSNGQSSSDSAKCSLRMYRKSKNKG